VFDKTGTITTGELHVAEILPVNGADDTIVRLLAGSLGAGSNHPLSRAAAAAVPEEQRLQLDTVRELGGFGVTGQLDGEQIVLGRSDFFERLNIPAPPPPAHDGPIAGVSRGDTFLGWVLFYDRVRSNAGAAVRELRGLGVERMMLLTGDRSSVAQKVAKEVGIDEVFASMLPEQKMERVMQEIKRGYRPMVVGDGINDSLALRAGAVGVAMGARGGEVAVASADLALMTNDLRRLGTCLRLSQRCQSTIHVNVAIGLAFTIGLTGAAAAGVLGGEAPIIAAVLHNVSTFLGLANAGRLLRFDETQQPAAPAAAA
jgi:Cd2+/Zn2+-exporting ATPase